MLRCSMWYLSTRDRRDTKDTNSSRLLSYLPGEPVRLLSRIAAKLPSEIIPSTRESSSLSSSRWITRVRALYIISGVEQNRRDCKSFGQASREEIALVLKFLANYESGPQWDCRPI